MLVTEPDCFSYTSTKALLSPEIPFLAREGVTMATDKFEHATFYLTKNQVDEIKELARKNQISRSALVRMIIREYLARQNGEKDKK